MSARDDFQVFHTEICSTVDSYTPNFTTKFHPIGAGVGRWPQNCQFYEIFEYKRPTGAYPLHEFYEIFRVRGQFDLGFYIWGFARKVLELWVGAAFPPKFSP